jgi:hypothetical protein
MDEHARQLAQNQQVLKKKTADRREAESVEAAKKTTEKQPLVDEEERLEEERLETARLEAARKRLVYMEAKRIARGNAIMKKQEQFSIDQRAHNESKKLLSI